MNAAANATRGAQSIPASFFSGDDPRLTVSAGRSRFNLPVLPAGDFPVMSSDGLSSRVSIDTNDLIRLIDKTRFAISTEETRYYLNGIYLHAAGTAKAATLRAVATDGHRLAQVDLPLPKGAEGMPGVIGRASCRERVLDHV